MNIWLFEVGLQVRFVTSQSVLEVTYFQLVVVFVEGKYPCINSDDKGW